MGNDITSDAASYPSGRGGPGHDSAAFERLGTAWRELLPLSDGRFRLRLGGLFQTGWLSALCSGLAKHALSIDGAHARLGHDQRWIAELVLVRLDPTLDPVGLPYLQLTQEQTTVGETEGLSLEAYTLTQTPDHGGTLLLQLKAPDSVGLLGSLLSLGKRVSLFPVEMHIETRHGRAYDSLWLAVHGDEALTMARQDFDRALRVCLRSA